MARHLDVIIFGASGYTGRLVAEHLARKHSGSVRWALAGRSAEKLQAIRDAWPGAGDVEIVIADVNDGASLAAMCEQTKALINTAGPYQRYGAPVVAACTAAGTDYIDLAGEVFWVQQMITDYHHAARASGARIVMSGGFESIPFDIAVQMIQDKAIEETGGPAIHVSGFIKELPNGGYSGGGLASLGGIMAALEAKPELAQIFADPFAYTPGHRGADQPDGGTVRYDETLFAWLAPSLLSPMNSKIVHRTNFLLGGRYGDAFTYEEMSIGGGGEEGRKAAEAAADEVEATVALARSGTIAAGDGPPREVLDRCPYELLFVGTLATGETIRVAVTGDMDYALGSTSKMIAEAGLCLAVDGGGEGGFWTPAAAMGSRLRRRLVDHAGMTFEFV